MTGKPYSFVLNTDGFIVGSLSHVRVYTFSNLIWDR